jgi:serine/threonine-protein kinase RsbW
MVSESPSFTLTLPSDLKYVAVARAFVEAVCEAANLDGGVTSAAVLATNEAANNVVRHAHREQPERPWHITLRLEPEALEISVLDEGAPFDLSAVPRLDPTELRIGGRGIFLIRSVMDEVVCLPRDDRGNALRMVKRWRCRHV